MLTLHRLRLEDANWERMDAMPGRLVFQTREWLEFVAETQNAEPVLAAVRDDGREVGYFTGLVVKRLGLRILGSPFPGWTTDYLGFNLADGVIRRDAAEALLRFAFGPLRCLHVELCDRYLSADNLEGSRYEVDRSHRTFVLDLSGSEDEVFGRMTSACRRAVRKSVKVGVRVEEAHGLSFADEYYEQLQGVFARQSLVPTYGVERVRALLRHLEKTDHLLLVRAVAPDGQGIATGIFLAFDDMAHFWGGASVRDQQILRPNEAIFWFAMRWARQRGCTTMDFGGGGQYKTRYGAEELWLAKFRCSRLPLLGSLRNAAATLVDAQLALRGRRDSVLARLRSRGSQESRERAATATAAE